MNQVLTLKNIFLSYWQLLVLVTGYCLLRLPHLTLLPIFNDEAIYLDWGWREIHLPGNLFLSLFDAKQPLLLWIFGLAQNVVADPLLAGRLVSVCFGGATAYGLFLLAKMYLNPKLAWIAPLTYMVIPLFTFFDRQALMESAVTAIGVWSLYFFISLIQTRDSLNALGLGLIMGIGFFIKSSAVLFVSPLIIILLIILLEGRFPGDKRKLFLHMVFAVVVSQLILLPLYAQNDFWQKLGTNSRYALTVKELIAFPFTKWGQNILAAVQIMFWQLTPLTFIATIAGLILFVRRNKLENTVLLIWFIVPLVVYTLITRNPSVRYTDSLLPLVAIFTAKALTSLPLLRYQLFAGISGLGVSLMISGILISNPLMYFNLLDKLTPFSQKREYVTNWSAGYGIPQVRDFLQEKGKQSKLIVGVRSDSGNPENAMFAYFNASKRIVPTFFDSANLGIGQNDSTACIKANIPLYFVSRDGNLGGLDRFLVPVGRFSKPEEKSYVGIYTLKPECEGKSINIKYQ